MPEARSVAAGLRPARRTDCRRLAQLAAIAGEGIPEYLWSQMAQGHERPIEVGARRVASEEGDYSYRNATVAERGGQVVAMVLAYTLPAETDATPLDDYPALVRPMVELERIVPGSYYINMLATLPGFRGRGLGSLLLEAVGARALAAACRMLSVGVFEQNTGALRLYQRHGFRETARRAAVPHPCRPYDGDVLMLTRLLEGDPTAD